MSRKRSWPLTLAMLLASSTSCFRSHSCPTCPPLRDPPPPITVEAARPPCNLPPLPQPATLGGVPDGDRVIVTKDGLGQLAVYLAGVRAWIGAAAICLEVKP